MLRLLYSVACENPIVADTGVTSLIAILERVTATLPKEAPEKILIPMKWSLVCLWTRDEQDFSKPVMYEQEVVVTAKEGDKLIEFSQPFEISNKHVNFRNITEFAVFPISPGGKVTVTARVRPPKGKWSEPASYTILSTRNEMEVLKDDNKPVGHKNNKNNKGNGKP